MKKEMNEVQMRKYAEYDDIRSSVSLKFCSLAKTAIQNEGSVASRDYISAAQLMLIAHDLPQ